jgi:hypothetical protein
MLGIGGLLVSVLWLVITDNIDGYYGSATDMAEVTDVAAETGKSVSASRKPPPPPPPPLRQPSHENVSGLK